MSLKKKLWIAGIALAICGVVFTRVVSQTIETPSNRLIIYLIGILLALTGLIVIFFAMSRR
jgi:drug/metabolite transporter (DMT)-like permease